MLESTPRIATKPTRGIQTGAKWHSRTQLKRTSNLQMAGAMIPLAMSSSELQGLHEEGFLTLELLQGQVLSDNAVRPIPIPENLVQAEEHLLDEHG